MPLDAGGSCRCLQVAKELAGAADHQPRVGELAHDLTHRFDQKPLPGERVQTLDVDEHVTLRQPERLTHGELRARPRDSANAVETGG